MKTKASLTILVGVGLIAMAAPAAAHDVIRDDVRRIHHDHYGVRYDVHYDYRRGEMPRWLKRHRGFRHWYRHSRYERNRRMSWNRLWDIYTWERRHGARYDVRVDIYGDAYRGGYRDRFDDDDRRKSKSRSKNKHRQH